MADRATRNAASATLPMGFVLRRSLDSVKAVGSQIATMRVSAGGIGMPLLHDEGYRSQVINRIQSLRPDTPKRWGQMSADQMLWHVNGGLSMALGQIDVEPQEPPLPPPRMRWPGRNLP